MLLIVITPAPVVAVIYPTGVVLGIIIAGVVAVILGSVTVHGHAPFNIVCHFIYCLLGQIFQNKTLTSNVSALLSDAMFRLPAVKVLVILPTGCVS